jgi:hypothetical protein
MFSQTESWGSTSEEKSRHGESNQQSELIGYSPDKNVTHAFTPLCAEFSCVLFGVPSSKQLKPPSGAPGIQPAFGDSKF